MSTPPPVNDWDEYPDDYWEDIDLEEYWPSDDSDMEEPDPYEQ